MNPVVCTRGAAGGDTLLESRHDVSKAGLLHAFHPLAKLFVLTLICASVFVFKPWYVAAALAATLALLHATPGIGLGRLLSVLKPLPVFMVLIIVANMFLVSHPGPPWRGVAAGVVQAVRVLVVIMGANLFLAATDPLDLSESALRAARPLTRIGFRTGELSLMVMIIFSFLPLMGDEAKRLEVAQAVRCGFPKRGVGAVKAAAVLLAPLVLGVFRRAEEIDLSLRARCYRLDAPRSALPSARAGRFDYVVCAVSALLFVAGLYAQR